MHTRRGRRGDANKLAQLDIGEIKHVKFDLSCEAADGQGHGQGMFTLRGEAGTSKHGRNKNVASNSLNEVLLNCCCNEISNPIMIMPDSALEEEIMFKSELKLYSQIETAVLR